jgi:hypothetical protein
MTPRILRDTNGVPVFGQVSFCNGINFFNIAHRLEAEGRLAVPTEGTSGMIPLR